MAHQLPTDSIHKPQADEVKAFVASPEGQKAVEQYLDNTDFRDQFGTRRKDLSESQAIALVFADATASMEKGYLVIEGNHGCAEVWDPAEAEWVDADDFEPIQE